MINNLAEMIGTMSKLGGLEKFAQQKDQILMLLQNIVQMALISVVSRDYSTIDRLNTQVYPKLFSNMLLDDSCKSIL